MDIIVVCYENHKKNINTACAEIQSLLLWW